MDNSKKFGRRSRTHLSSTDGFVRRSPRSAGASGFDFRIRNGYKADQRDNDGLRRDRRYFDNDSRLDEVDAKHKSTREVFQQKFREKHKKADLRKPRKTGVLRLASKTLFVTFIILVISGGYLFGKGYLRARQIFQGGGNAVALNENVDPSQLNGEGDGRVNILLLGSGGEEHDNASFLMDTIIVASIDPIHNEAVLLSIPRDFYVKTNFGYKESMKINAVYKIARNHHYQKNPNDSAGAEAFGFTAIETEIEEAMGIPIHYYAMIDFTGFKKAIDTVGGVSVNVAEPVYEANMRIDGRNYTLDVKTGTQHFDGFRALAYVRSRKTSPRSDFSRSERQREILIALKNKIVTVSTLAKPMQINQLFNDFGNHMRTNLSVNELLRLHEIGNGIKNVGSLSLVDEPNVLVGGSSAIPGAQVPRAGLYNYLEIHKFVRNRLKDGFLRSENAKIAVLNGTNVTGLAARTAAELESYGYNITTVADSPIKNQAGTTIIDLRGGQYKYTSAYLEKRFEVKTSGTIPDSRINSEGADFVIILGQNEQDRLQN